MKRPIISALIALCLLVESTGAAMASPPQSFGARPFFAQLQLDVVTVLQSFASNAVVTTQPVGLHVSRAPHLTAAQMRATLPTHREHQAPREGFRLPGPPMSQRPPDPSKLRPAASAAGFMQHLPQLALPHWPTFGVQPRRQAAFRNLVHAAVTQTSTPSVSGMASWWTFSSGPIAGVGGYSVNVSNGNGIVESTDLDIAERGGLNLTLDRVYNSNVGSQRDWNASGTSDDGAPTPGQFGQGWTNNYDTHLAQNSAGGVTVFAGDGTRYDFSGPADSNGCLVAPTGVYSTLCSDGGYGYWLQEPSGVLIHYYTPNVSALPSDQTAYAGRLYQVFGRNRNVFVTASYAWNVPSAIDARQLASMTITHQDGDKLVLNFGNNPNSNNATLLLSVQRPGENVPTIYYTYDGSNDLKTVELPSNGVGISGSANNSTYMYGYGGPGEVAPAFRAADSPFLSDKPAS